NQIVTASPPDPAMLALLADIESYEGQVRMRKGELEAALPYAERALAVREQAVAALHTDGPMSRNLMLSYSHVGTLTRDIMGAGPPKVADAYQKMAAIAERLAAADTSNRSAQYDLSMSLMRLATIRIDNQDFERALDPAERCVAVLRKLVGPNDPNLIW